MHLISKKISNLAVITPMAIFGNRILLQHCLSLAQLIKAYTINNQVFWLVLILIVMLLAWWIFRAARNKKELISLTNEPEKHLLTSEKTLAFFIDAKGKHKEIID
jgi:hypothetical protein